MDDSSLLYKRDRYVDITKEFKACSITDGQILMAPSYDLSEAVCSVDVMHPLMDRGLLQIDGMSIFAYYQHATDVLLLASPLASREPEREFIYTFSRRLCVILISFLSGIPALDTLCVCIPLQACRMVIRHAPLRWLLWLVRRAAVLATETVVRARVVRSDEFSMASALIERWRSTMDLGDLFWREQMTLELGVPGEWRRELSPFYQLVCFLENVLGLARGKDTTICGLCDRCDDVINSEDEGRVYGEACSKKYTDQDFFIIPLLANVFCTGCVRRPVRWMEENEAYAALKKFLRIGWDNLDMACPASQVPLNRFLEISASSDLPLSPVIRSAIAMIYLPDPTTNIHPITWPESIMRLSLHTLARQRRMLPELLKSWRSLQSLWTQGHLGATFLAIWYVILGFALDLYNDDADDGREVGEAHWMIAALCRMGGKFEDLHNVAARLQMHHRVRTTVNRVYDDHRMIRRWAPVLFFLERDTLDYLCVDLHHLNVNSNTMEEGGPGLKSFMTNAQCYAEYLPSLLGTAHSLVLY